MSIAHDTYRSIWLEPVDQPPTLRVTATIIEPSDTDLALEGVKPEKPGSVYYLRSGGYIKIGWASNLTKRMRSYPPDSVLLATEPGTLQDEARQHKRFAAHRTHGREWYAMVPALMQHIDRVRAEHGEPDLVTFAAQPVTVPQPRPRQYIGGNYRGQGLIGEPRNPLIR
ncbi:MAG: GIY-YIG nuclease family protein [Mycobacteriaceae bacterium]